MRYLAFIVAVWTVRGFVLADDLALFDIVVEDTVRNTARPAVVGATDPASL